MEYITYQRHSQDRHAPLKVSFLGKRFWKAFSTIACKLRLSQTEERLEARKIFFEQPIRNVIDQARYNKQNALAGFNQILNEISYFEIALRRYVKDLMKNVLD